MMAHHFPVPLDVVLESDGGRNLDAQIRAVLRAQQGQQQDRVPLLALDIFQKVFGRFAQMDLRFQGLLEIAGQAVQVFSVDLHAVGVSSIIR